jgi:hypothetical protein
LPIDTNAVATQPMAMTNAPTMPAASNARGTGSGRTVVSAVTTR